VHECEKKSEIKTEGARESEKQRYREIETERLRERDDKGGIDEDERLLYQDKPVKFILSTMLLTQANISYLGQEYQGFRQEASVEV